MMNSTNSLSRFLSRVKGTLLLLVALFATIGMHAQTPVNKTFTACALNIDGLPQTMAGITVNGDGPGAEGTQAIGQYIVNKGIDILGLSEDFNYNGDLIVGLDNNYQMGTWRGRIDASGIFSGLHFNTDGLMFLLKNQNSSGQNMSYSNETWVQWEESLGGLSNGANENVDKGYRFYTVNLGDNVKIDVYILHMNTAEGPDQIALQDRQLTQLANAILANGDGRPKLVIGDTNCRYTRNKVVDNLITPLSASYDIKDVWVEKFRNGTAPDYTPDVDDDIVVSDKTNSKAYETGEIVDKIFYLNPKGGNLSFTLNDLVFDADNYKKENGSLLGDHVPVIATFTISGTLSDENYTPATQPEFWVGEELNVAKNETKANGGVYIFNVGTGLFITGGVGSQPHVNDINSAEKWGTGDGNTTGTTVFANGDLRIRMSNSSDGGIGIIKKTSWRGGTEFYVKESTTTVGAYKFDADYWTLMDGTSTHHFNIEKSGDTYTYTGARTSSLSVDNDWLFISEAQKNAYKAYEKAYDNAKGLLSDKSLSGLRDDEPELFDALEQVLLETTNTNYTTSKEDTKKLIEAYNNIMNRPSINRTITSVEYGTVCLPWNAWVPQGVTVYAAAAYTDKGDTRYVTLQKYTNPQGNNGKNVIPAKTGFIIYSKTPDTYTFIYTRKQANAPQGNLLSGNPEQNSVRQGDNDGCVYGLANKSQGLGFYNLNSGQNIAANCAYIVLKPQEVTQVKRVAFIFDGEDIPTAIDKAESAINANATAVYGVAGEQRSALRRGINIVRMSDGTVRKVAVK
ncbi:MAG: hypothetical protein SPJ79_04980 [Prevotella sp.]|nr:hypothetical protein [Prevotella sp.]